MRLWGIEILEKPKMKNFDNIVDRPSVNFAPHFHVLRVVGLTEGWPGHFCGDSGEVMFDFSTPALAASPWMARCQPSMKNASLRDTYLLCLLQSIIAHITLSKLQQTLPTGSTFTSKDVHVYVAILAAVASTKVLCAGAAQCLALPPSERTPSCTTPTLKH